MEATITLREYLAKGKQFVIPSYQRGYVWGKSRNDGKDSVSYILDTLLHKFELNDSVFLQGITVTELPKQIVLIDGQQRTTFLYLLLKCLGKPRPFDINYEVRAESQASLEGLDPADDFSTYADADFQDEAYFKKTVHLIKSKLAHVIADRKDEFLAFVLDNIRFLYIKIPEKQARKVFTMMNGNKAIMLQQELMKAELLRLISLNEGEETESPWELEALRSRYAREWDKWLHWWNRPEVKTAFNSKTQLGLLFMALNAIDKKSQPNFDAFVERVLGGERNRKKANDAFNQIRRVQKRFEDVFADPLRHNYVGAILRILSPTDAKKFIQEYFNNGTSFDLPKYYLCAFMDMRHSDIVEKNYKVPFETFKDYYDTIKGADVYNTDAKEKVFRLLLRLNIDEDNLQNNGKGRKFDFAIWDDGLRSIEHIMAKSTVYHIEGNKYVRGDGKQITETETTNMTNRADMGKIIDPIDKITPLQVTEHCIGNMAMLYGVENTMFGNKTYEEKKRIFLTGRYEDKDGKNKTFRSRHLMHTIYKFADSDWTVQHIRNNFEQTLRDLINTYLEPEKNDDQQN